MKQWIFFRFGSQSWEEKLLLMVIYPHTFVAPNCLQAWIRDLFWISTRSWSANNTPKLTPQSRTNLPTFRKKRRETKTASRIISSDPDTRWARNKAPLFLLDRSLTIFLASQHIKYELAILWAKWAIAIDQKTLYFPLHFLTIEGHPCKQPRQPSSRETPLFSPIIPLIQTKWSQPFSASRPIKHCYSPGSNMNCAISLDPSSANYLRNCWLSTIS